MGILSTITETAGNIAKNVLRGRSKQSSNERVTYHTEEKISENTVKSTDSDHPPHIPLKDKINSAMVKHDETAKSIIGVSQTVREKANKLLSTAQNPRQIVASYASSHPAQVAFIQKTSAEITKNPVVVGIRKNSIRHDLAAPGNMFIQAFTGQNPEKRYMKKSKGIKLGKKISKKEQKQLVAKYGKNWQKAVKSNSTGYFANPSHQEVELIKRENMLDSGSLNFGSAFPEPSQFISSQFSRQPFISRITDPMDIDANFMGERGSGFTSSHKDPFAFKGLKL